MALENFGHDEAVVMGTVMEEVLHGERADTLIILDKSNPTYPNLVACEFFGDRNRGVIANVRVGERVKVIGTVRSKKWKDRWFTSFSCFALSRFDEIRTPVAEPEAPRPQHREENGGGRGGDLPF